jgi:hypothetical protein
MARARLSLAQARLTGAYSKNPQRYRPRSEPTGLDPIGDAPDWLAPDIAAEFRALIAAMPWLNSSHVGITAIAATLQARMAQGVLGIPGLQLLRVTLNQMGGTPVSAHKVAAPAGSSEPDPADQYFDNA